ncbi:MAG: nitroreductase family protein [Erysipelotrichaceae bacterium]|jgi:nitroreductase|nr:nitroreductase family protein [Erysipelotrichaceae bacterium]
MDFLTLAKERYSVRRFSQKPVEQEKIDAILEAARLAPTAANAQPQRVLVIQSPEALAKLKDCTPYHFNAPLAFLVCYDTQTVWRRKYDGHNSGDVDASIVGTHMMMEAMDLGIGSTWVMAFDPAATKTAYNLPDHIVPVAFFTMGYPAEDSVPSPMHDKSLGIEEIVFYNKF